MVKQAQFWRSLAGVLEHDDPAVLMIVVDSTGSTPGKTGAKMVVTGGGECFGTIGGGMIEQTMVNQSRSMIAQGLFTPRLSRQPVSGQASGMVCGGEQTVMLYACRAGDIELFHRLSGNSSGVLVFSPDGVEFDETLAVASRNRFAMRSPHDWRYELMIGFAKQVYLIGGGHVSLALSKILATLDFEITVIDERSNVHTMQCNHEAHHKWIMPYRELGGMIPEGRRVFVLIMTHSHKTDEQIAESLAGKHIYYLGVLGSKKKMAQLRANLHTRLPDEWLQRIRGPIGLPINSHTPEEIAVSIAAELIQLSNAAGDSSAS